MINIRHPIAQRLIAEAEAAEQREHARIINTLAPRHDIFCRCRTCKPPLV